ncbi:Alpha/Beta hydrolase protein [Geopyxis carbonaria]|nr:Alpha/Beta hydrolase protein [Geopyxis carbonaria]
MAIQTVSLPAQSLHTNFKGIITGENDHIVQYRGIKFASIAHRFARSKLVTSYDEEVVDCTIHGRICPNSSFMGGLSQNVDLEQSFMCVPENQWKRKSEEDELDCLRLVITAPKELPTDGSKIPVFVNFPGGANLRSATGVNMFDYTKLVEVSVELKKPVIAIHVPYRVGLFGYGVLPNGVGGNNALFDQRNALEWIKRNISMFGGDPHNITVAGESAGAFSVDCHLQAKGTETNKNLQYFKRAVLSSGTMRLLAPKTVESQIELSKKAANSIGFTGEDWAEKLAAASVDEIVDAQSKLGLTGMCAVDDGEWFEDGAGKLEKTVVPTWCESLMIGDCAYEGFLFARQHLNTPSEVTVKKLENSGTVGEKLLSLYPKIKAADSSPGDRFNETLNLLHDIFFGYPSYLMAKAWRDSGKSVYEYAFDQDNPWDASRKAHHGCDLLYWFNAYNLPTPEDQAVAHEMQESLIKFVCGEEPWSKTAYYAFGPGGPTGGGELTLDQFRERRRPENFPKFDQYGYLAMRDVGQYCLVKGWSAKHDSAHDRLLW